MCQHLNDMNIQGFYLGGGGNFHFLPPEFTCLLFGSVQIWACLANHFLSHATIGNLLFKVRFQILDHPEYLLWETQQCQSSREADSITNKLGKERAWEDYFSGTRLHSEPEKNSRAYDSSAQFSAEQDKISSLGILLSDQKLSNITSFEGCMAVSLLATLSNVAALATT